MTINWQKNYQEQMEQNRKATQVILRQNSEIVDKTNRLAALERENQQLKEALKQSAQRFHAMAHIGGLATSFYACREDICIRYRALLEAKP